MHYHWPVHKSYTEAKALGRFSLYYPIWGKTDSNVPIEIAAFSGDGLEDSSSFRKSWVVFV